MRLFGFLLLAIGFFGSAFLTVRHADSADLEWQTIEWSYYALTFVIGVVGVVILRVTAGKGATEAHKVEEDLAALDRSLGNILERLRGMIQGRQSIGVYDVHGRIDSELAVELAEFVEAREVMIHRFGLHNYASVMDRFAGGERQINRAWSASADGYVDEVWASLEIAEQQMKKAHEALEASKQGA